MKKFMLTFIVLPILATFSCSGEDEATGLLENSTNNNNVTIQLRAEPEVTEHISSFEKTNTGKIFTRAGETSSDSIFTPILPSTFKAYFVAAENKGQYQAGSMVKTVVVNDGTNDITVPAMKYKIYVTNYDIDNIQNNSDVEASLPESSSILYYYGSDEKDLDSSGIIVDIALTEPYAAVAIYKNNCISSAPIYKDSSTYSSTGNWYYLYIRNSETSTKIPVSIAGNGTSTYALEKDISPKHVYQYTLSKSTTSTEGSLNITVNGFSNTYNSTINL